MTAFGRATVHLLMAVLLACPYVCLSRVAVAAGPSAASSRRSCCCGCCSRGGVQDTKQGPAQPDSRQESGGGGCLCHGAVMGRHVDTTALHQAVVAFVLLDTAALVRPKLAVERGFSTEQSPCHFGAADSGRELRALIASLLL